MHSTVATGLDPASEAFYRDAMALLDRAGIEFLVGGTFAYARYLRFDRATKDLDVFLRPADVAGALAAFAEAGYDTSLPFPHWLAKVRRDGRLMDVVFSSGNGIATVDDAWFAHAAVAQVLGLSVRLCPLEEMIWSKAYLQERERFDGADVLHLMREAGADIHWERLLARFGEHWPVLLAHVTLFRFVYPDKRQLVPQEIVSELAARLAAQRPDTDDRVCYGTLLSREQYLYDVEELGYRDARLRPLGAMTPEQTRIWTDAIARDRNQA